MTFFKTDLCDEFYFLSWFSDHPISQYALHLPGATIAIAADVIWEVCTGCQNPFEKSEFELCL